MCAQKKFHPSMKRENPGLAHRLFFHENKGVTEVLFAKIQEEEMVKIQELQDITELIIRSLELPGRSSYTVLKTTVNYFVFERRVVGALQSALADVNLALQ